MGDSVAADQQPNGRFMLHLPPGTVVEALFEDFLKPQNNAFYDGRVRNEVKDGVYHVDFVDGDVDEMCPEWKLRPINVVQFGMLPNGCDVRAKWEKDNLYYDAKVLRANASNKTYDIQFKDDGNLAYGVPVTRLRYSSAFTRSEEITEGMIVLVQWSLSCFAPGRVVTKNKDRTFHVRSLNFETRRATLQQLTRVYGYVPVRLLGEPDTLCSGCGKDDPKGKLATCDWCKCSYHPGCAPNSIPSGKTYYCKACVGLDRSKPRTEELPPLQSIYPLIAPPSQGASANNSKPKPRSRSNSKGQKRGAGSQSSENEDDNAPLKKPKNAPNKKSSRTSKPPSMATGESSGINDRSVWMARTDNQLPPSVCTNMILRSLLSLKSDWSMRQCDREASTNEKKGLGVAVQSKCNDCFCIGDTSDEGYDSSFDFRLFGGEGDGSHRCQCFGQSQKADWNCDDDEGFVEMVDWCKIMRGFGGMKKAGTADDWTTIQQGFSDWTTTQRGGGAKADKTEKGGSKKAGGGEGKGNEGKGGSKGGDKEGGQERGKGGAGSGGGGSGKKGGNGDGGGDDGDGDKERKKEMRKEESDEEDGENKKKKKGKKDKKERKGIESGSDSEEDGGNERGKKRKKGGEDVDGEEGNKKEKREDKKGRETKEGERKKEEEKKDNAKGGKNGSVNETRMEVRNEKNEDEDEDRIPRRRARPPLIKSTVVESVRENEPKEARVEKTEGKGEKKEETHDKSVKGKKEMIDEKEGKKDKSEGAGEKKEKEKEKVKEKKEEESKENEKKREKVGEKKEEKKMENGNKKDKKDEKEKETGSKKDKKEEKEKENGNKKDKKDEKEKETGSKKEKKDEKEKPKTVEKKEGDGNKKEKERENVNKKDKKEEKKEEKKAEKKEEKKVEKKEEKKTEKETESVPDSAPKKRGRPPKDKSEGGQKTTRKEENEGDERGEAAKRGGKDNGKDGEKETKKKGRPPKNKDTPAEGNGKKKDGAVKDSGKGGKKRKQENPEEEAKKKKRKESLLAMLYGAKTKDSEEGEERIPKRGGEEKKKRKESLLDKMYGLDDGAEQGGEKIPKIGKEKRDGDGGGDKTHKESGKRDAETGKEKREEEREGEGGKSKEGGKREEKERKRDRKEDEEDENEGKVAKKRKEEDVEAEVRKGKKDKEDKGDKEKETSKEEKQDAKEKKLHKKKEGGKVEKNENKPQPVELPEEEGLKKRGRPKKVEVEEEGGKGIEGNDEEEGPKKRGRKPKKVETEKEEDDEEREGDEKEEEGPKKRGRKPKTVEKEKEEDDEEKEGDDKEEANKRGSKPKRVEKEKEEDDEKKEGDDKEGEGPKKRGRKPKTVEKEKEEDDEKKQGDDKEKEGPKKRGRKPKTVEKEKEEDDEKKEGDDKEEEGPKKRGRKPKTVEKEKKEDDEEKERDDKEEEEPKKRGRKPKKVETEKEEGVEENEGDDKKEEEPRKKEPKKRAKKAESEEVEMKEESKQEKETPKKRGRKPKEAERKKTEKNEESDKEEEQEPKETPAAAKAKGKKPENAAVAKEKDTGKQTESKKKTPGKSETTKSVEEKKKKKEKKIAPAVQVLSMYTPGGRERSQRRAAVTATKKMQNVADSDEDPFEDSSGSDDTVSRKRRRSGSGSGSGSGSNSEEEDDEEEEGDASGDSSQAESEVEIDEVEVEDVVQGVAEVETGSKKRGRPAKEGGPANNKNLIDVTCKMPDCGEHFTDMLEFKRHVRGIHLPKESKKKKKDPSQKKKPGGYAREKSLKPLQTKKAKAGKAPRVEMISNKMGLVYREIYKAGEPEGEEADASDNESDGGDMVVPADVPYNAKEQIYEHLPRSLSAPSPVFPEWFPSKDNTSVVAFEDGERHFPTSDQSLPFRPYRGDVETARLARFEAMSISDWAVWQDGGSTEDGDFLINVGGALWASAWCPSDPDKSETEDQYIALGVYRGTEESHRIGRCQAGPGMIQIWNCGRLADDPTGSEPMLALGLLHDYGHVTDLCWCPVGARQQPDSAPLGGKKGYPRLGLLAATFGDGSLRIFAVPHPSALTKDKDPVLVRSTPVVTLRSEGCVLWRVDWAHHNGAMLLAAGSTIGTVLVWNVAGLVGKSLDEVYPIHHIPVCNAPINQVVWCPTDPDLLCVCDLRGQVHIFDMRDPSMPVRELTPTKGWVTRMRWDYGAEGLVVVDDGGRVRQYRLEATPTAKTASMRAAIHGCMVWDLCVLTHKSSCLSVDEDGHVRWAYLPRSNEKYHHKGGREVVLFRQYMKEDEDGTSVYVVHDYPPTIHHKAEVATAESLSAVRPNAQIMDFPPRENALHRIAVNPNVGANDWVLFGGASGLVRLRCISDLTHGRPQVPQSIANEPGPKKSNATARKKPKKKMSRR